MSTTLCTNCVETMYEFEPEMGSDDMTFSDGTCDRCGETDMIVWTFDRECAHDSATCDDSHTYRCDDCGRITGHMLPCPRTGKVTAGCHVPVPIITGWLRAHWRLCPSCDGFGHVYEPAA